ncbi:MAG: flavodoxin family protein [Desulfobacterales bacterium]|nr:flavodoxin family protein [Desulfobacterales bacterium]
MKNILGIICSPRKLGNSEILIKEIGKHIPIPHELRLLRLSDFDIRPCKGCYTCLFNEKGCMLDDDLNVILEAIFAADALIVAAPTYFLGANAVLKLLLDRGLALLPHIEQLWGKPSVGVGIAGIEGKEGYTLLNIRSFLKLTMTNIKRIEMLYGALPGEVFPNRNNKNIAAGLADALFAEPIESKSPSCPLCGGDTFQFVGGNQIKCMLCSNAGTLEMKGETPVFHVRRSEHELFLTKEEAIRHREWLRRMKGRFVEHKHQLKKVILPYIKGWDWVKP